MRERDRESLAELSENFSISCEQGDKTGGPARERSHGMDGGSAAAGRVGVHRRGGGWAGGSKPLMSKTFFFC